MTYHGTRCVNSEDSFLLSWRQKSSTSFLAQFGKFLKYLRHAGLWRTPVLLKSPSVFPLLVWAFAQGLVDDLRARVV